MVVASDNGAQVATFTEIRFDFIKENYGNAGKGRQTELLTPAPRKLVRTIQHGGLGLLPRCES